jgi:uncharacterized membrane protein
MLIITATRAGEENHPLEGDAASGPRIVEWNRKWVMKAGMWPDGRTRGGSGSMATTVWRFSGTEGADEAVLTLKQLEAAKLIEVQDATVIRWPQYAADPAVSEHVTQEGSRVSSFMHKFTHTGIDSSMVDAATGDMTQGSSVLVLLTPDAAIEAVAKTLGEQGAELIRSDLSVQEQDQVRAASGDSADTDPPQRPGNTPET